MRKILVFQHVAHELLGTLNPLLKKKGFVYEHLKLEFRRIEEALKKEIPVLEICLGAQLVAPVLGAKVQKSPEKEIGWYDVHLADHGAKDLVFKGFKKNEKVFQLRGDTFEVAKRCRPLGLDYRHFINLFHYLVLKKKRPPWPLATGNPKKVSV